MCWFSLYNDPFCEGHHSCLMHPRRTHRGCVCDRIQSEEDAPRQCVHRARILDSYSATCITPSRVSSSDVHACIVSHRQPCDRVDPELNISARNSTLLFGVINECGASAFDWTGWQTVLQSFRRVCVRVERLTGRTTAWHKLFPPTLSPHYLHTGGYLAPRLFFKSKATTGVWELVVFRMHRYHATLVCRVERELHT